jgi:hypothetical protein
MDKEIKTPNQIIQAIKHLFSSEKEIKERLKKLEESK